MKLPPLTWVALAFLTGLVFADITGAPISAGLFGLAGTISVWSLLLFFQKYTVSGYLIRKNKSLGLSPLLLLLASFLGMVRFQIDHLPNTPRDLGWYNGSNPVTFRAVITDYPDIRDTYQLLVVSAITIHSSPGTQNTHSVRGKAIIRTGITNQWQYGDLISISGIMSTPTDEADFSYREYLSRRDIFSSLYYPELSLISSDKGFALKKWIFSIRESAHGTIKAILPSPESSLLSGILLGLDTEIPETLQSDFQSTGTTHIIAISGFNISILAALLSTIFFRISGARLGALLTIVALFIYCILAGSDASVIRAAIMGAMGIFASLIGRRQTGINSLAFTALVMCLMEPDLPWDISFQLSFFSTLGLILFAGPISQQLKVILGKIIHLPRVDLLVGYISEYFFYTLAALIMTVPIMAYHFHSLSWVSLLVNPLILPAQPAVMVLGGLALLFGLVWLPLGSFLAHLAYPFIAYTIRIVELFGAFAAKNEISIQVQLGFLLLYYSILIILLQHTTLGLWKRLIQPKLSIVYMFAMAVFLWQLVLGLPDARMHVYVSGNGGTENILIQTPAGRYIMIGAGSSSSALSQTLGRFLPAGFPQLDYIFLSPEDGPSINVLNHAITGILVNHLVWTGLPGDTSTIRNLEGKLMNTSFTTTVYPSLSNYLLAPDSCLSVYPIDTQSSMIVLHWQEYTMLIPSGPVPSDWLDHYKRNYDWTPTVIILAKNGDPNINLPGDIRKLKPQVVIINSTQGNGKYSTIFDYEHFQVFSTSEYGWIQFHTDGQTFSVESAHPHK